MSRIPKYPRHGAFREELNGSVEAYFRDNGLSKTGGGPLLAKSAVIMSWFCCSYAAMVFWAGPWWQVGLCATSLGLALAGIGFSIMHDGGHGVSSKRKWVSRLAAYSLDFVGGSSHLWTFKHNVVHHQFPNVDGVDNDIVAEPWLRMTTTQRRRAHHRAQHIYFPLAYALLTAKWMLYDDFRALLTRRMGDLQRPRVPARKIAEILAWKLFVLGWAFALPIALHGVAWTLLAFVVWSGVSGIALATVFQLAHTVDRTEITQPPPAGERSERTWAHQQVASTANFAPSNRIVTWYVGGLNFQVEHHLFPRISHVHYPALAPIVERVCVAHGMPYHTQKSVWAALASHRRHLRALG